MINKLNTIYDIQINVGYDDINKPNLFQYNYFPNWINDTKDISNKYLNWLHIDKFLGNELDNFNPQSVDTFYNNNESFIYPITLYTNDLFETYSTIDISNTLLKYIKLKKAKIVFFYITEGYFGQYMLHYNWLDDLSTKYNLDVDDLLIVTANLMANENYFNNKFKIIPYNYFGDELLFASIVKKDILKNNGENIEINYQKKLLKEKYIYFINNYKIKKHFLCFNNLIKLHRLWMCYELTKNPNLVNKSIISLSNESEIGFENLISLSNNKELIDYFKTHISTIGQVYDTDNWKRDVLQASHTININAHLSTFVNIVTETLTTPNVVFITEKTYKPIYVCQPFIIVGNAHTLKKMKELGYKTFSNWWDESYDNELELEIRMNKIIKVLEEISNWDLDKCNNIRKEMREILIHNYNNMLNNDELYKLFSLLQTNTKNKSII